MDQLIAGTNRGEVVVYQVDAHRTASECGKIIARMQSASSRKAEDAFFRFRDEDEDDPVDRKKYYPQDDAPYSVGEQGGPGEVSGVCFGTTGAEGSCVVTTFRGLGDEQEGVKPMLRVWLQPASDPEAVAERLEAVLAHFGKDGKSDPFLLMLMHASRAEHASLLFEMEFDFDEAPLCLASLAGRERVVTGCEDSTLKVVNLNRRMVESSCSAHLLREGSEASLHRMEIACDAQGFVVVGSVRIHALSVFRDAGGDRPLELVHTFSLNKCSPICMCVDDGLVVVTDEDTNFLVADYRRGVVLKTQPKEPRAEYERFVYGVCITSRYIACTVNRVGFEYHPCPSHLAVYDIFMGRGQLADLKLTRQPQKSAAAAPAPSSSKTDPLVMLEQLTASRAAESLRNQQAFQEAWKHEAEVPWSCVLGGPLPPGSVLADADGAAVLAEQTRNPVQELTRNL
jgi:hypothetical protein